MLSSYPQLLQGHALCIFLREAGEDVRQGASLACFYDDAVFQCVCVCVCVGGGGGGGGVVHLTRNCCRDMRSASSSVNLAKISVRGLASRASRMMLWRTMRSHCAVHGGMRFLGLKTWSVLVPPGDGSEAPGDWSPPWAALHTHAVTFRSHQSC